MKLNQINELGFTEVFTINFNSDVLTNLQKKIYEITKDLIIDHDLNLEVEKKISLPFSKIQSKKTWSELMETINDSEEFSNLINSDEIINTFKSIHKKPKIFKISTFRARFPEQNRVVYNWHQDEGTWFMSKKEDLLTKFPTTLWFSINGASKKESIQLVKKSHNLKLFEHKYVEGQGFFNLKDNSFINHDLIETIETLPSECIMFNSLTIHRSVENKSINMRPRYSADIRYYDEIEENKKIKIDNFFKIKRVFKNFFK